MFFPLTHTMIEISLKERGADYMTELPWSSLADLEDLIYENHKTEASER